MLARNCQRAGGDIAEHGGMGERHMGEHGGACAEKSPLRERGFATGKAIAVQYSSASIIVSTRVVIEESAGLSEPNSSALS